MRPSTHSLSTRCLASYCARSLTIARLAFLGVLYLLLPGLVNAQPATTRVSVGSGGIQGNFPSRGPAISPDGRWVAFDSSATNLVPDDTNDTVDVFLHDRQTGTTTRVSVGPGGVQGDNGSYSPSISADGRIVAFSSVAGNLVDEDTNHVEDVFVYDRETGITRKVSVGPGGAQGTMESDDGAISADGRWIAFNSSASNLVPDDTNGYGDVFVNDRLATSPMPPSGLVVDSIDGHLVTLRWTSLHSGRRPLTS
jgi:Tol biopolymer transport system component